MSAVSAYREMNAAPGEWQRPSLALVNTRRNSPTGPIDELASPGALRAWLRAHGFAVKRRCRAADVAAFHELRDAVRRLLLARIDGRVPDQAALAVVNRAAAAASTARRLQWTAEGPVEMRDCLGARDVTLAGALLAADAIELVVGDDHADLRACAAPGCIRLLLRDHPRRQWCSTRCGDRVRASRYYRRHRSPSREDGA
jgi:predicted RNA-binding Zn ribbon-like protein